MEHIALYRQFRPITFDEVIEQRTTVSALKQAVVSGKISHAYLFCGTRGTGKTSLAKIFSRAINCENNINGNPCNDCPTCKGILNGTLLDVIEIDAASNNSVDNIRRICDEVVFSPSKAKYKVYIIDEVHMLSAGAFNALLKTLEEPPKHAVFILATTEPFRIPATIHSRCQRYDFRRISPEAIASRLEFICKSEHIEASKESLNLIASLADGALRDAVSLLDQAAGVSSNSKVTTDIVESITGISDSSFMLRMADILISGNYEALLPLCKELSDSGRDLIHFTIDLAGFFRDLLVIRMMPDPTTLVTASNSSLKEMYKVASRTNAETLVAFISYLSNAVSEFKWSPSIRTSFEISLLRLCGRKIKADAVPLVVPDFIAKQEQASIDHTKEVKEVKEVNDIKDDIISNFSSAIEENRVVVEPSKVEDTVPTITTALEENEEDSTNSNDENDIRDESSTLDTDVSQDIIEDEDPDDKPLENQIDIFSMVSSTPTPSRSNSNNQTKGFNLSSMSASFLDDFALTQEVKKETPSVSVSSPKPSSLAQVFRDTELLVDHTQDAKIRTPQVSLGDGDSSSSKFVATVWDTITNRIKEDNFALYISFSTSKLEILEDGAYIIFENDKTSLIKQLASDPTFKSISNEIKDALSDVGHVYICTQMQYDKTYASKYPHSLDKDSINDAIFEPTNDRREEESLNPDLQNFLNTTKDMGIDTEIHFGDI